MKNDGRVVAEGNGYMLPVFRGLADAKIPGNVMAGIVGVAAPTYSKWRTGKTKMPAATVVFLTLLLANKIEELQEVAPKSLRFQANVKSIIRHLQHQELINGRLHPRAIRQGARLFRQWWQQTSGQQPAQPETTSDDALSSSAMSPPHIAAYKKIQTQKPERMGGTP